MSATAQIAPMTARVFLLGGDAGADTGEVLGRALSQHGVARSALQAVRHLSGSAVQTVDREIGTVADGLLDLDLGEVLVAGWRKHVALTESAKRTLAAPGSEEIVALASHRITSTSSPHVDLFLDDAKVKTLEFELEIVFDLTALSAVVRLGELVALRGGECLVTATLTLEGWRLAERQGHIDLALTVQLQPGVTLVDKAEATESASPPQATGLSADSTIV